MTSNGCKSCPYQPSDSVWLSIGTCQWVCKEGYKEDGQFCVRGSPAEKGMIRLTLTLNISSASFPDQQARYANVLAMLLRVSPSLMKVERMNGRRQQPTVTVVFQVETFQGTQELQLDLKKVNEALEAHGVPIAVQLQYEYLRGNAQVTTSRAASEDCDFFATVLIAAAAAAAAAVLGSTGRLSTCINM
eukprot:748621-Hanusia_phi.AAC.1